MNLLLPQVVCLQYCDFDLTDCKLPGLMRYLENAFMQDEFRYTCPLDSEILFAYRSVGKYQKTEEEQGRRSVKKPASCR